MLTLFANNEMLGHQLQIISGFGTNCKPLQTMAPISNNYVVYTKGVDVGGVALIANDYFLWKIILAIWHQFQ